MKNKAKLSVKTMVQVAFFAAIIAALSQISIPLPFGVPVTLQTLAVALCGYVLGWKLGLIATGVYVLLGAAGLPVFSQFGGGPGVLFGLAGGFIWGFLALAALCGLGMRRKEKAVGIALGVAGLFACHLLGVIQFSLVTGTAMGKSMLLVSLPFLVKDVISVAGAYLLAGVIRAALIKARLMENG
jgi:biotin transport system substrate-specific component